MRKLLIATLGLGFVLALAAQQAQAPVEITSEPSHHLVVDNAFLRSFAVSVDPGKSTLMHHHGHDYLSVSVGDAQIMNTKEGAQPVAVAFKDGDVRFTSAGLVHAVANTGSKPFRNATIEILGTTTNQKACTEACAIPEPCESADKSACASVAKLYSADQWIVTLITLPPGAGLSQHTHAGNYLVIPLVDAEATNKTQGQPAAVRHYKTGEVTWNNPVTHAVTNTGKTTSRIVVLEFKGPAAK